MKNSQTSNHRTLAAAVVKLRAALRRSFPPPPPLLLGLLVALGAAITTTQAQTVEPATALAESTLKAVITMPDDTITNGVTLTPDAKRIFMVIQRQTGQDSLPQVAEYVNGALLPFPNAAYSQYTAGQDASNVFVHVNALRFGPDGTLWVVDMGHELGAPDTVPHAAKLVGFDINTGATTHIYYFDSVVRKKSAVDDVRFDGDYAYLTDAGRPGLIVLRLSDGTMHRALDEDPSTTALRPVFAAGHAAITAKGKLFYFHADQLEVTPDGKTLYFEPASGPVSAIDVQYLNDASLSDAERATHVSEHAEIGSTGGSAIDAQGNMYATDVNRGGIVKIMPNGKVIPLLYDPLLLHWADALWITADGTLWIPVPQLDRTSGLNDGVDGVHYPVMVYTAKINIAPSPIDHQ